MDFPALNLDDPQTQAWLGMSAALLQAGGASPYPVGIGEALGRGIQGGLQGYKSAQENQIQQQRLRQMKQQNDLNEQFAPMMNNPQGFSPDALEAMGMKLAMGGHPGAATLAKIADARRAQEKAQKDFAGMRSGEGYGGLFGNLTESPYVGDEAKALQAQLDKSEAGNPEQWMKHYERLRTTHFQGVQADKKGDEAPVAIIGPKGQPIYVSRRDAIGKTPANVGSSAPVMNTDLHGPEYAATLDPTTRNIAEGLANYTINPQTLSNRAGERKQMLAHARQINPSYDQNQFTARSALRKDFTSGKAATNVTAINTAIGHIATLDQMYEALQNGDTQAVNTVVNAVRQQTGDPRVNNAQIAIGAVSNELMRVFRQVGASEAEIKDWEKKFTTSMSRGQSKGAVKTSAELLESRINALNDQWDRGMETKGGFPGMVSPKAAKFLESMRTPAAPAAASGGWTVRVKEK